MSENSELPEVKPKKTDPRIVRTKQLLSQALTGLLGEGCFEDITIQDILERSTVNRATFYAHFEDKDTLLHFTLSTLFERILHERLAPNAVAGERNLELLLLALCDFFGHLARCTKLRTVQANPRVEAAIKPIVHNVIAGWFRHHPQGGFDAAIEASTLSWMICGSAIQWHRWNREHEPIPANTFVRKMLPALLLRMEPLLGRVSPRPPAQSDRILPALGLQYAYTDESGMI
ncbi:transcriptional regulator, TetR family [Verrucomicrobium sp. GAS474]|uniref:TetR/AcrR family transcriptional regulator n=1 Tax=Verrucomicrobium sp. GAS474 TaxID=1882831 RepID=UPI00087ACF4D|nr:TetR/AcrR family transcriptional regulator [Verrucomicrobium sp. GAS474]SDT85754.1 transcriptional regulator, TetR family [Verrucomicrobium sp. GAS474]